MPSVSARPSESYRVATTARRGRAASSPSLPLPGRRSQCLKVRLVSELGREALQGLPGMLLCSVEAAVYERLDASSQGVEQCRDKEGGGYHREGGLLTREDEDPLQQDDAADVECDQRGR
jgi:hypothetical protein